MQGDVEGHAARSLNPRNNKEELKMNKTFLEQRSTQVVQQVITEEDKALPKAASGIHITIKDGAIRLEGGPPVIKDVVGRTLMSLLPKRDKAAVRKTNSFLERIKPFLNAEISIKLEGDINPVLYVLRETGTDFLIVDYGESQRIIPLNKIAFVQIGSYPKEQ
jgi:hypothetical protein